MIPARMRSEERKARVEAAAHNAGLTSSGLINALLDWHLGVPGAELPPQPEEPWMVPTTFRINNGPPLKGSLTFERDVQRVTTAHPIPDPDWEFVDGHGHYHARSRDKNAPLPTLRQHGQHIDCDGSCGFEGGCEGYTTTSYRCLICGEDVVPGVIPGPHTITIEAARSWSCTVEGVVTDESVSVSIEHDGEVVAFGMATPVEVTRETGFVVAGRTTLAGVGLLGERRGRGR